MWFGVAPRAYTKRTRFQNIGLCAQKMITILDLLINIFGHCLTSMRIFSLVMNKMFIRAPKLQDSAYNIARRGSLPLIFCIHMHSLEAPATSVCQQEQSQGESAGSKRNRSKQGSKWERGWLREPRAARSNRSRSPRRRAGRRRRRAD
jgi:hypothetical protein